MKKKINLLLFTFLAFVGSAWSHALWIETDANGQLNIKQEIKIFYGEYAEQHIEPIADWYSDVKNFDLWLVTPSGKKQKIETSPLENHYLAYFTPTEEGLHQIFISHEAKDLGGKTLYQFNTTSIVKVGNTKNKLNHEHLNIDLKLIPHDKNNFTVYFKGTPEPNVAVELTGPSGWTKVFQSDANGKISLETPWEGSYMLEATKSTKESGEHHENAYESVWRCATFKIASLFN
ncbi:DUF4198 domain-containing protein [Belliella sp. DSM 111904]|uniref:DUF4198 domain-containing protein n=1 Tax=Belliella filtrata TaxID=2923435 RepID=A0ABS9UZD1_9BACT|nr:DUF4198 domain-containing protein [Belliella filtrata]MCH7409521.1 DUF4198 domain-containing protein [Belliella filtrata]